MSKFDCVIGYEFEKQELRQIADVLKNKEAYEKLGVSSPKGLLLHGEPGVGKSLMAKALIEESGRPSFICRKDRPNGDFIKAIKSTFTAALRSAPSIVFLDDMDKFANGDEMRRDAEEYVTVQSCIDEIRGSEVFIMATANNIRHLPNSLIRAGRFDRTIEIEAPHGTDAEKIIAHYLGGKKFIGGIETKTIARILDGHSCAELETVINEAGLYAGYDRAEEITMDHFMKACLRTVYDVTDSSLGAEEARIDLSNSKNPQAQTVYHEAGHAVLSEILCPESVTLVSMIGNDHNHRGFTSYHCDRSMDSMSWKKSRILTSLGGMAALEQSYGLIGDGSSNDLDHAFRHMRHLVNDLCVCGFNFYSYGEDSPELQAKQEQATATEIEKYYRMAKEILSVNADFFEKIAQALAQKKLLTMGDVQAIKADCKVTPFSL